MFSNSCFDLSAKLPIGWMVLLHKCSIAFGSILSQRPVFKVYDSQAYRNMEMARKSISFTFDLYLFKLSSALCFTIKCALGALQKIWVFLKVYGGYAYKRKNTCLWDTDSQKSIDFLLNPICVPRIYVTVY